MRHRLQICTQVRVRISSIPTASAAKAVASKRAITCRRRPGNRRGRWCGQSADALRKCRADLASRLTKFEAKSATRPSERLICPSCQHTCRNRQSSRADSVHCENCGNSFRLERAWLGSTIDEIRIVGRFQLLDRVGQGSFGTVWRGSDTQLDRIVAVKVPHQHAIESGAGRRATRARSAGRRPAPPPGNRAPLRDLDRRRLAGAGLRLHRGSSPSRNC